jgi:hypothetical protein
MDYDKLLEAAESHRGCVALTDREVIDDLVQAVRELRAETTELQARYDALWEVDRILIRDLQIKLERRGVIL